jgi:hypothetical protein
MLGRQRKTAKEERDGRGWKRMQRKMVTAV